MKDGRIWEIFFLFFREENVQVTLLYRACFVQKVLHNRQTKTKMPCEMSMRTAFEANLDLRAFLFDDQKNLKEVEDQLKCS